MIDIIRRHSEWEAESLLSFETIIQLGKHDSLVNAWISTWRAGSCSFEKMLFGLVKDLAEKNIKLMDELVEIEMRSQRSFAVTQNTEAT